MSSITSLVPIRVDASSSDGAVRIVDTLLIDTTCLPVSQPILAHNGNNSSAGLGSLSEERSSNIFSLSSLVDANSEYLAESVLADAEVYGAVRSHSKSFMGGRLDLLGDTKLFQTLEKQISNQLGIALSTEKMDLIVSGGAIAGGKAYPTPDGTVSSNDSGGKESFAKQSKIVRINLRLRHEHIVVIDEFDYDVGCSGMEGCDPFSIAKGLVEDLKLPHEIAPEIAASIVEQIYGVDVSGSLDTFTANPVIRQVPTALVLDPNREGSATDFAQIMLNIRK